MILTEIWGIGLTGVVRRLSVTAKVPCNLLRTAEHHVQEQQRRERGHHGKKKKHSGYVERWLDTCPVDSHQGVSREPAAMHAHSGIVVQTQGAAGLSYRRWLQALSAGV